MLLEPFEVDGSLHFLELRREQQGRFVQKQSGKSGGYSNGVRL